MSQFFKPKAVMAISVQRGSSVFKPENVMAVGVAVLVVDPEGEQLPMTVTKRRFVYPFQREQIDDVTWNEVWNRNDDTRGVYDRLEKEAEQQTLSTRQVTQAVAKFMEEQCLAHDGLVIVGDCLPHHEGFLSMLFGMHLDRESTNHLPSFDDKKEGEDGYEEGVSYRGSPFCIDTFKTTLKQMHDDADVWWEPLVIPDRYVKDFMPDNNAEATAFEYLLLVERYMSIMGGLVYPESDSDDEDEEDCCDTKPTSDGFVAKEVPEEGEDVTVFELARDVRILTNCVRHLNSSLSGAFALGAAAVAVMALHAYMTVNGGSTLL